MPTGWLLQSPQKYFFGGGEEGGQSMEGAVHHLCPTGMGAPVLQSRALGTSAAGEVVREELPGDWLTLYIVFIF